MLAGGMSLEETKSFLETHKILETTVCIAAVNSPTACTLSGIPDKIKSVHKMLDDAGIFNRVLHVNIAFHSHHTESIKGDFLSMQTGIHVMCFNLFIFHYFGFIIMSTCSLLHT